MLRIVAENLAENAIRYAGHGATFTLSVTREPRRLASSTAADDGIGVAEGDLPRLFERFWRADAARATRGTGLGLAIVKHVVVAAGGRSRRPARADTACRSAALPGMSRIYVWMVLSVFAAATRTVFTLMTRSIASAMVRALPAFRADRRFELVGSRF